MKRTSRKPARRGGALLLSGGPRLLALLAAASVLVLSLAHAPWAAAQEREGYWKLAETRLDSEDYTREFTGCGSPITWTDKDKKLFLSFTTHLRVTVSGTSLEMHHDTVDCYDTGELPYPSRPNHYAKKCEWTPFPKKIVPGETYPITVRAYITDDGGTLGINAKIANFSLEDLLGDVTGASGAGRAVSLCAPNLAKGEQAAGKETVKTLEISLGRPSGDPPGQGVFRARVSSGGVPGAWGEVLYIYEWVDTSTENRPPPVDPGTTATTIAAVGPTDDADGHDDRPAGKVPGPKRWWEWLAGTLVPGLVAGGLSLAGGLFGGGGAAPPTTPRPPRPKYVPPADAPRIGAPGPYREAPDGPLIYPPGTTPPPGYRPPRQASSAPAEWVPQDEHEAYAKTMSDALKALGKGTYDFTAGTLNTILTGYVEIGNLGFELTDRRGPSVIKEIYKSPSIIWNTGLNIGRDVLESINPIEELEALRDPYMSPEGKMWAWSSLAIKIANVLVMWESGKDLKKGLETKYKNLRDSLKGAPKEPAPVAPKPAKPPQPGSRVSKVTPKEAVNQAKNTVPPEKAAAYRKYTRKVGETVNRFAEKVKRGKPITREDVLKGTKDPNCTRQLLGKTKEPVPPEVTKALKKGRRAIYDVTDEGTLTKLRKKPKYAEGNIRVKEVSTGGAADATGSVDRDVTFIHEKQVVGKDGVVRTVREVIPRSEVEALYNESFAEATNLDPSRPVEGITRAKWNKMSLQERQAAHARQYQQSVMDRTHGEWIVEHSGERPPQISPEQWDNMSVAEQQAACAKVTGKMHSDPLWKGRIYEEKVLKPWREGTHSSRTEALHQLGKTGGEAQKAAEAAGKALDPQTMDALEIVRRGGDPAMVDQALKNLGVRGGVEGLTNRLSSIIATK